MGIQTITRAPSLFEMALEAIRVAIVDGTIELGEHLSEAKLSKRFGISKTPVREALQELRREGLVQIDPQSGTRVFMPDETEIEEIFDMRALLETAAASRLFKADWKEAAGRMAAIVERMEGCVREADHLQYRQLDSSFHNLIIGGSGNRLIQEAYRPLSSKIDALRSRGLQSTQVVHKSLVFHRKLLGLLDRGEETKFIRSLTTHIDNSCSDYRAWLVVRA